MSVDIVLFIILLLFKITYYLWSLTVNIIVVYLLLFIIVLSQRPKNPGNKIALSINLYTFYRIEISGVYYEILRINKRRQDS